MTQILIIVHFVYPENFCYLCKRYVTWCNMSDTKISIRFYNDREVRAIWDEETMNK